jgi:hypothetical protein
MSINSTRSALYKMARILGDFQAIRKGTYGKRLVRKFAYHGVNGWLRRLLK